MSVSGGSARVADVRLSSFERLPWRRIILVILAVVIATVAVLGAYKTLTLPEGESFSSAGWKGLVVQGSTQGADRRHDRPRVQASSTASSG